MIFSKGAVYDVRGGGKEQPHKGLQLRNIMKQFSIKACCDVPVKSYCIKKEREKWQQQN